MYNRTYLCICTSFFDTASSSECLALSQRMNSEQSTGKDVEGNGCDVIWGAEEGHKSSQSGYLISSWCFYPGISQTESRSAATKALCLMLGVGLHLDWCSIGWHISEYQWCIAACEVPTVVYWGLTLCAWVNISQHFEGMSGNMQWENITSQKTKWCNVLQSGKCTFCVWILLQFKLRYKTHFSHSYKWHCSLVMYFDVFI